MRPFPKAKKNFYKNNYFIKNFIFRVSEINLFLAFTLRKYIVIFNFMCIQIHKNSRELVLKCLCLGWCYNWQRIRHDMKKKRKYISIKRVFWIVFVLKVEIRHPGIIQEFLSANIIKGIRKDIVITFWL